MVLRFILCTLVSWICELPERPIPAPTPFPTIQPTITVESPQNLDTNRYYGKGAVGTGVSEFDTGYCDGFTVYEGNGGLGSLSWPVDPQYRLIRPERAFGQHEGYLHTGIDFDMPSGSNVYAAGSGTVVWAGYNTYGFGELVAISHGGGWISIYGHLQSVNVTCGQYVGAGAIIGLSQGTPNFSHLHFEIRNGLWSYNPLLYL